MLLITIFAAVLRLWQLDHLPPGLYRDEAYNGLDALDVLAGNWQLYFANNNGREPFNIYLTAVSVGLFGRTVWAVRLGAAVVGTLTTLTVYQLGKSWFNEQIGFLSAWLWAVTVWPLHLSRIGFRVVTVVPFLALSAWLITVAYKRQRPLWWVIAGLIYGLSYYTYLAIRFTPLVLLVALFYLWWSGGWQKGMWISYLWYTLGFLVAISPLLWVGWQQPNLFLGRTGQVSILSQDINQGDLWGTLVQHIFKSLGMFFWAGDDIIRHNPPSRPVFDALMAVPFIIGLWWCLRHWRTPAAGGLLIWTAVMLGPTILAEDAPHFLRAVGILPAILMFPAIGLSQIASWPKLAKPWRLLVATIIMIGSFGLTIRDYFAVYGQQSDTAYLFEAAARDLAEQINAESPTTAVYWDEGRYGTQWPSIEFLVQPEKRPLPLTNDAVFLPASWYMWPHDSTAVEQVSTVISSPAVVSATVGSLARGDLEPDPYPFFVRYTAEPDSIEKEKVVSFAQKYALNNPSFTILEEKQSIAVDLYWSALTTAADRPAVTVFVHVLDIQTGTLIGQSDTIPAQGYWPTEWWTNNLIVHDQHTIELTIPFDPDSHHVLVGLYPLGQSDARLSVVNDAGEPTSDTWRITP